LIFLDRNLKKYIKIAEPSDTYSSVVLINSVGLYSLYCMVFKLKSNVTFTVMLPYINHENLPSHFSR